VRIVTNIQLIDTHAHLDHDPFDADRAEMLQRARNAGLTNIVVVGTTLAGSRGALKLAHEHDFLFATVGIHPNHAAEAAPDDWMQIVELAKDPRCVGLGETGLDKYWDDTPFPLQQDFFARHIELSQLTKLPLVIHTRECMDDAIAMLRDARSKGGLYGVMHSFTGNQSQAAECLDLGLYISFAGMVTFKKSDDLRAVAKTIPSEKILIETDAPYLAPQPVRGKRNEPAYSAHTAECLAQVRGVTTSEFGQTTTENAKRLFRLPS
jgi:TatD DNase family protein